MRRRFTDAYCAETEPNRLIAGSSRMILPVSAVATLLLAQASLFGQINPPAALPESPKPQHSEQGPLGASQTVSATALVAATITGTVADTSGAAIPGAVIRLSADHASTTTLTKADSDGVFSFASLTAGEYTLLISAQGFAPRIVSASVSAGQSYTTPQITLVPATSIDVEVGVSRTEIAEIELNAEEKQRVLGVIPNFYVTYDADAVPLSPTQKFKLAGTLFLDPISFGVTGLTAGIQQANNSYSGYGQGAAGYGKRYAATTGTFLTGVLIGNAILPSILRQDPRYFYKGTGSVRSRILYAVSMSVVAKGDNGRWQPNYSGIIGGLAAAGIANAYYPAKDRDGVQLTFVNAAIGTAEVAAGNLFQEFLVRKLTPHTDRSKP